MAFEPPPTQATRRAGSTNLPPFGSTLRVKAQGGVKGFKPWFTKWFMLDDTGVLWFQSEAASSDRKLARGRVPMHLLTSAAPP